MISQTTARQAPLSSTVSQSLLRLMSTESVMLSNHLFLCRPLLLFPQVVLASGSFPMSWLLASVGQSIGASASTSVLPMNLQGFPYHGYTSYFVKGSAPMLTGHLDQPCQDSCSHTHPSFLCAWLNFHGTHHQTNHLYLTTCSWELPRWYW